MQEPGRPPVGGEGLRGRVTSAALFLITGLCVYWVYGTQWMQGAPFSDGPTARGAARFAAGLMGLLLAHEMGHYLVARAHGFRLSLPFFLPVPFAFGTFGAIIQLRSLPRSRTALLEMGAAGPLAGFAVALLLFALGLPETQAHTQPELVVASAQVLAELASLPAPEPGPWDVIFEAPVLRHLFAAPPPGTIPMLILANPPVMDLLGLVFLGRVPGRYDVLDPLAMAGWVGCLVTAVNLLPIGQLDGGHVFNALAPRFAGRLSRLGVGLAILAGLWWPGWAFWGLLLLGLRAWRSLPVPPHPGPRPRARVVALLAGLTFLSCFMPRPLEVEHLPLDQIRFVDPTGQPLALPASRR
ncbi:site-2 protease family protein [Myxococcota bacterium]|nr:site-2 protease family protein [Myxococcota bacterium]